MGGMTGRSEERGEVEGRGGDGSGKGLWVGRERNSALN